MHSFEQHLNILLVFFVYGLAFFSMGIALTLEAGRSPLLAERRLLKPLAAFGLLHGAHEWFEIFLHQAEFLNAPFPIIVEWVRVGWLAVSFIPLVIFGVMGLNLFFYQRKFLEFYASAFLLVIFFVFAFFLGQSNPVRADALSRYMLAIPGGILAAFALYSRSNRIETEERPYLAARFRWASAGFGIYGLSQIFVPQTDLFFGNIMYSGIFLELTGIPIQVVRAASALFITINLIKAIQRVEREREQQLQSAQQEKLLAMERIQDELLKREALRQELLRHIVIAQEEERSRIARELHDETAQVLTAFSLDLATLRELSKRRTNILDILDRLQSLTRQMSQGIYRLVRDLRPAQLDDLGLPPALQHLCDQFERQGLQASIEISGGQQRLDPLVETVLFRIAQEALSNVNRHARVNQARMHLQYDENLVILKIEDEGIGFDPQEDLTPPHGWGLAGMRERAQSVGGELQIHSKHGRGTLVEISIPVVERLIYEEAPHGV
jgi:signal transduction histidine kinase